MGVVEEKYAVPARRRCPSCCTTTAAAALVGAVAVGLVVRFAEEHAQVPGGWTCVTVAFVLPLLGPFIVAKEVLVNRALESAFATRAVRWLVPTADFAKQELPAPDYADEDAAWSALPWRSDTADHVPPECELCGQDRQHLMDEVADVFYLAPTTFYNSCCWNAPYDDPYAAYLQDEAIIPQQALVFNSAGRVFAPRYRQMSGFAYFAEDESAREQAIDLAYSDVRRAFEHFLEHWNGERPIIIAAHSQGAEHGARLLNDFFSDKAPGAHALRQRLVAAYLVGMPVYEKQLQQWGIQPCGTATQLACVVAFQSFLDGAEPEHFAFEPASPSLRQAEGARDRVCVNPLSWASGDSGFVPKEENAGSMHVIQWHQNWNFLFGERIGATRRERQVHRIKSGVLPLRANLVGAQCRNGSLFVDHPPFSDQDSNPLHRVFPVWRTASFPGGNLHPMDYNLFWANLRANANARVQAWFASRASAL